MNDLLLALGIVGCFVMAYLWANLLYEIFQILNGKD